MHVFLKKVIIQPQEIKHAHTDSSKECLLIQLVVGDSAQMLVGRSMGQHYACPNLSPKKTYEGLWGSCQIFSRRVRIWNGKSVWQACSSIFEHPRGTRGKGTKQDGYRIDVCAVVLMPENEWSAE